MFFNNLIISNKTHIHSNDQLILNLAINPKILISHNCFYFFARPRILYMCEQDITQIKKHVNEV